MLLSSEPVPATTSPFREECTQLMQELLGHANIATILDTYSHLLPGTSGQSTAALESHSF